MTDDFDCIPASFSGSRRRKDIGYISAVGRNLSQRHVIYDAIISSDMMYLRSARAWRSISSFLLREAEERRMALPRIMIASRW